MSRRRRRVGAWRPRRASPSAADAGGRCRGRGVRRRGVAERGLGAATSPGADRLGGRGERRRRGRIAGLLRRREVVEPLGDRRPARRRRGRAARRPSCAELRGRVRRGPAPGSGSVARLLVEALRRRPRRPATPASASGPARRPPRAASSSAAARSSWLRSSAVSSSRRRAASAAAGSARRRSAVGRERRRRWRRSAARSRARPRRAGVLRVGDERQRHGDAGISDGGDSSDRRRQRHRHGVGRPGVVGEADGPLADARRRSARRRPAARARSAKASRVRQPAVGGPGDDQVRQADDDGRRRPTTHERRRRRAASAAHSVQAHGSTQPAATSTRATTGDERRQQPATVSQRPHGAQPAAHGAQQLAEPPELAEGHGATRRLRHRPVIAPLIARSSAGVRSRRAAHEERAPRPARSSTRPTVATPAPRRPVAAVADVVRHARPAASGNRANQLPSLRVLGLEESRRGCPTAGRRRSPHVARAEVGDEGDGSRP